MVRCTAKSGNDNRRALCEARNFLFPRLMSGAIDKKTVAEKFSITASGGK
jgi:hypothetical protein